LLPQLVCFSVAGPILPQRSAPPKGSLPEGAVAARRLRECTHAAQGTSRKVTNNDPHISLWSGAAQGDSLSLRCAQTAPSGREPWSLPPPVCFSAAGFHIAAKGRAAKRLPPRGSCRREATEGVHPRSTKDKPQSNERRSAPARMARRGGGRSLSLRCAQTAPSGREPWLLPQLVRFSVAGPILPQRSAPPKGSLPEGAVAVRRLRECTQAALMPICKGRNGDPLPHARLAARGDAPSVFATLRQLPRGGSLGCCRSLSAFLPPVPYCRKGAPPKGSLPEGAVAVRRLRECTQAALMPICKGRNGDPRPPAWLAAWGDAPSVFAALRQLPQGGSLGLCRSLSAFLPPVSILPQKRAAKRLPPRGSCRREATEGVHAGSMGDKPQSNEQ